MPHPIMFRDDDFGLAEVRRIALAFPGAFEKISHGRPVFYAPKSFVWYGGSSKQSGAVVRYDHAIMIKPAEDERPAFEQDQRFFYPMYLGPSGWLGFDLTAADVDWSEVAELIDTSYRLVASKTLIRELDQRTEGVS